MNTRAELAELVSEATKIKNPIGISRIISVMLASLDDEDDFREMTEWRLRQMADGAKKLVELARGT